jgi:hypothetical protein
MRDEVRGGRAEEREQQAADGHRRRARGPALHEKASAIVPEQDCDERPHLHHAVAAGELLVVRCCGRYAYFTGPKSVECNPIRKTEHIRGGSRAAR